MTVATSDLTGEPDRPTRTEEDLLAEHDAERPARRLPPRLDLALSVVAAALSVFVLWRVFFPDSRGALPYRITFLAVVLPLTFLAYRPGLRRRAARRSDQPDRPGPLDWLLAALSLAACSWPLVGFDAFIGRAFEPTTADVAFGLLTVLLVLEATRRTIGWVLPAVCVGFLLYAYYGGYLPVSWTIGHKGYGVNRIVEQLYLTTEGLFGVPLDVAATYIVLFTIYGAVLDLSGAGKFFLDLSFAAFRRSRSAPGRTVTMAGFLLGTVSGSGTATAVSLGSVSWPILRRAGYPREQAGGVLAAAGIGAILSPPTLGAAAFIIAEFLRVSYLTVLLYASVPTLLYYLGILLAVEMDARRFGTRAVTVQAPPFWRLLARFGYHFSSLFVIVLLLALEVSVFRAVVYATLLAFTLSFLDKAHRLTPRRAFQALANGARGVLPVAATTAAAGIIVGVTTLTGLGLNLSGIIVDLAGALSDNATVVLIATVVLAAIAVLVLGTAVPVTASFIIAAVIIAPALKSLGVSDAETYMFIFYYAVLSEVSPPTALAAVAASAITGGSVMRTMLQTLKYSLPAFLVPFAFVLTPAGEGLLGQGPFPRIVLVSLISAVAVAALAVATGGWLVRAAGWPERALAGVAAVLLLYLAPVPVLTGLGVLLAAVVVHLLLRRGPDPAPPPADPAPPPADPAPPPLDPVPERN